MFLCLIEARYGLKIQALTLSRKSCFWFKHFWTGLFLWWPSAPDRTDTPQGAGAGWARLAGWGGAGAPKVAAARHPALPANPCGLSTAIGGARAGLRKKAISKKNGLG